MRWPLDFGPQSLWKSQGSILRQGIAGDASRGIGTLASGLNAAARLRPPSERSQNWAKPRIMTERSLRSKWWWMARFSQTKILTLWTKLFYFHPKETRCETVTSHLRVQFPKHNRTEWQCGDLVKKAVSSNRKIRKIDTQLTKVRTQVSKWDNTGQVNWTQASIEFGLDRPFWVSHAHRLMGDSLNDFKGHSRYASTYRGGPQTRGQYN